MFMGNLSSSRSSAADACAPHAICVDWIGSALIKLRNEEQLPMALVRTSVSCGNMRLHAHSAILG